MTTLQTTTFTCWLCNTDFSTTMVQSTNSFGGKRTDFHERAAGTQPLPYLIHQCEHCGYVGGKRDFEEAPARLTDLERLEIRDRIAELPPVVTPSERYERAAVIGRWLDLHERHLADLWLRAAWCAVDEGDREAERYYRRKAVQAFQITLEAWDDVARDERAVLTYLVGELYRRIGLTAKAHEWFDRVESEVLDTTTQQWCIDAARQQRECPREWFG